MTALSLVLLLALVSSLPLTLADFTGDYDPNGGFWGNAYPGETLCSGDVRVWNTTTLIMDASCETTVGFGYSDSVYIPEAGFGCSKGAITFNWQVISLDPGYKFQYCFVNSSNFFNCTTISNSMSPSSGYVDTGFVPVGESFEFLLLNPGANFPDSSRAQYAVTNFTGPSLLCGCAAVDVTQTLDVCPVVNASGNGNVIIPAGLEADNLVVYTNGFNVKLVFEAGATISMLDVVVRNNADTEQCTAGGVMLELNGATWNVQSFVSYCPVQVAGGSVNSATTFNINLSVPA